MKRHFGSMAVIVYCIGYGILCLYADLWTHFHIALNDFLGNLYMAEHLDFGNPGSFYNGFFPFGYALFLKAIPFGNPAAAACIANVFFGLVILCAAAWLGKKTLGSAWTLAMVAVLSVIPKLFEYITLPGPDIVAAAFVALGGTLLIRSQFQEPLDRRSAKRIVLGGMLLGLSALMRYHCLVLAGVLIFMTAFFSGKPLRRLAFGFIGMFIAYGYQAVMQILSGHGPFETAASFNAYQLFQEFNWYKISTISGQISPSVFSVVMSSPVEFARRYSASLLQTVPYLIPPAICVFLLSDKRQVKIHASILAASFLYFVIVCWATQRAVIPVLPFTFFSLAVFMKYGFNGVRIRLNDHRGETIAGTCIVLIFLALQLVRFLHADLGLIKNRRIANDRIRAVENVLARDGVTNAKEVFTDNFDFYLPRVKPYNPYRNGGWLRYGFPDYKKNYPDLSVINMEAFLQDCRLRGITHWVLGGNASDVFPELGQVAAGWIKPKGVIELAEMNGWKIFKIQSL